MQGSLFLCTHARPNVAFDDALLPVVSACIKAYALPCTAIIKHLLAVELLIALLKLPAVKGNCNVNIIIYAAHYIYNALKAAHINACEIGRASCRERV